MDPQIQAQYEAWGKQYDQQQEQEAEAQKPNAAEVLPSSAFHWMDQSRLGRATLSGIDSAVATADSMYDSQPMRKARDVAAGAITGAVNIADAGHSLAQSTVQNVKDSFAPEDPRAQADREIEDSIGRESDAAGARERDMQGAAAPSSPIWDHVKNTVLDFRDAVAVQDPTLADKLTQNVAQLAIPFMGYSRLLAGLHGFALATAAGAATDATALGPHDGRLADLMALGRHTEGKFGDVLRAIAPDGSAVNAYINYLTDRSDESEAEGRFKNVLDGFGANMIATPLLHTVGSVLKQGVAFTRYLAENGVRNTISDLAAPMKTPGGPAAQAGKIVFHGTPHDFDEFDTSKIGTGEGNQVYGHGLYFAENPKTGQYYRDALERRNVPAGSPMDTATTAIRQAGSARDAVASLTDQAAKARDPEWRDNLLKAADLVKSGRAAPKGKLLHVDIADEHLNNMLDWDKPLSEQKLPEAVTARLKGLKQYNSVRGADVYHELVNQLGSAPHASSFLSENGIPGIRYLDGGSRGAGAGSRNVVLFDAKHAKIVRKE
jgi:hypothetical protein